jgi:hypothetical protein
LVVLIKQIILLHAIQVLSPGLVENVTLGTGFFYFIAFKTISNGAAKKFLLNALNL